MRACARIAWRQARRAPGRAALVIAMIALPVTALTMGTTLMRTSVPTLEEHITANMGSAELQLTPPFYVDPAALEAQLPRGTRVVSIRQWNHSLVLDGTLIFVSGFESSVPIDQAPIPGLYRLMQGRAPARPGEAAVDPRVLELFDVDLGDELVVDERRFQIVGIAARPLYAHDALLALAPGTLGPVAAPGQVDHSPFGEVFVERYLVDVQHGADLRPIVEAIREYVIGIAERSDDPSVVEQIRAVDNHQEMIRTRASQADTLYDNRGPLTGVSFAGTAGALFATGLIAAAAFAVGIRRQLRVLGLVGAIGGDPVQLRSVVLLGGTTLGTAGAAVGIAVGVAGAYAVTPHLHRFTHSLPGAVDVHLPTIIGAGVLGVLAATLAAAWPARLAVRISTLDALASRMPQPRAPGRLARGGLVVVGIGALLTGVFFKPGENEVIFTAGLGLMLGGFLVAVPWLVTIAGRFAPLLPTASRLAVRDTARHGRRTGTAIAAAALALTTPVAVTAVSQSEESYQRRNRYIGEDHLLIGNLLSDNSGRPESLPEGLVAEIPRVLPGAIVVHQRTALLDLERYPPPEREKPIDFPIVDYPAYAEGPEITLPGDSGGSVTFVTESGDEAIDPGVGGPTQTYRESSQIMIGDADMLRALHAEEGIPALEAGKIVAIGPGSTDNGNIRLVLLSYQNEPPRVLLPAAEAGDISYSGEFLPTYVVSEKGAKTMGLLPGPPYYYNFLVAAPGPLTDEQIAAVKGVVAQWPGGYARTLEDFLPQFGLARLAATAGAALIALGIVAVVIALIGAEARRDQAILVAVGAGPRARRRISAARAGLVALLAAVIAIPAGFAPVTVVQWSRPEGFPVLVPWTTIAIVALGVPLVASGFGWLTSRAPKSTALLQPAA
jgi:putative ABC transport system permease protein